jgi:hypothetical protein
MNLHIPKWILAAFVGAAPMLGIVFFILFSCTLLGLVQRCKISLTRTYADRRRRTMTRDQSSMENETSKSTTPFRSKSSMVIISPFDDIPMKDIDAESSLKAYSDARDGKRLIVCCDIIRSRIRSFIVLRSFSYVEITSKSKSNNFYCRVRLRQSFIKHIQ